MSLSYMDASMYVSYIYISSLLPRRDQIALGQLPGQVAETKHK